MRLLYLFPLLLLACKSPQPAAAQLPPEAAPYESGRRSFDGTGKYYFGREIAQVMGHEGAGWLERPEREAEERASLLLGALPIGPASVIADIGAGTGYHSFPMAQRAPQGKVYAVDIQPEMLGIIRRKQAQLGIANVEPLLGSETDTRLPPASVDLLLLVDVYHECAYPHEMLQSMYRSLKPGGRACLVEYRAEDPSVPIKPLHKLSAAQARREWEAAGFRWVSTDSELLPWQHLIVFERPADGK